MSTFTLKKDRRKHKVAVSRMYPLVHDGRRDGLNWYVRAGVYVKPTGGGKLQYAHRSLEGVIPIPLLIRWALKRGFIKWNEESEGTNGTDKRHGPVRPNAVPAGDWEEPDATVPRIRKRGRKKRAPGGVDERK